MTVPTAEWFGVVAWASAATALWVDRLWQCRRWHQGLNAPVADVVPWDEPATVPATVADPGRDTEKAAS
jgi:hypothetical protein